MDLVAEHRLRMLRTSNAYAKWQAMQKSLPNTSSKLSIKIEQVLEVGDSWSTVQEGDVVVYMALCLTICCNEHVSMQTSVILLSTLHALSFEVSSSHPAAVQTCKKNSSTTLCLPGECGVALGIWCIDTLRFNHCLMSQ